MELGGQFLPCPVLLELGFFSIGEVEIAQGADLVLGVFSVGFQGLDAHVLAVFPFQGGLAVDLGKVILEFCEELFLISGVGVVVGGLLIGVLSRPRYVVFGVFGVASAVGDVGLIPCRPVWGWCRGGAGETALIRLCIRGIDRVTVC